VGESIATVGGEGLSAVNQDVPNMLNPRPDLRNAVAMEMPRTSHARLGLLGGLPGVLSHMARDGATPDIKTFAQVCIDCIDYETSECKACLTTEIMIINHLSKLV